MSDSPQSSLDRPQPRGAGGLTIAVLLIAVGAAFLLSNLGLIRLNWEQLFRLWPVLLILLGLDLVWGRRSAWGSAAVAILSLGVVAGAIWWAQSPAAGAASSGQLVTGTIHVPIEKDVRALKVIVELSDSPLELRAEPEESMVHGEYKVLADMQPEVDYEVNGGMGVVTIIQPPRVGLPSGFGFVSEEQITVTLDLPKGIPIDLQVKTDLGQTRVDVSELQISNLEVNTGSGQTTVVLPQEGEIGDVRVDGDLGQVTVTAPDGSTLDIGSLDVTSGSGALTVTLPQAGKIGDLTVDGDLGPVTVSVPDNARLDIDSYTVTSGSGALVAQLPPQGKLGAVKIDGDLGSVTVSVPGGASDVSIESLDIKAGSGSLTVTLPGAGRYAASIKADLGSVSVNIPGSLEARLKIDSDLGSVSVDESRFESTGDGQWETEGYGSADNQAEVTIESGSGSVSVK